LLKTGSAMDGFMGSFLFITAIFFATTNKYLLTGLISIDNFLIYAAYNS